MSKKRSRAQFSVRNLDEEEECSTNETMASAQPMDLAFHPVSGLLGVATIEGTVELFEFNETLKRMDTWKIHEESCRAIDFTECYAITGGKDASLQWIDLNGKKIHEITKAHDESISRLKVLDEQLVATGDDEGKIKIWDLRSYQTIRTYEEHMDYVADFAYCPEKKTLLSTSGDGLLVVHDLGRKKAVAVSENQDEELLSVAIVKNGKKAIVGTQSGTLEIFSWDNWGDCTDRLVGHPGPIDAMVALDDQHVLTGAGDGAIRRVKVLPNKIEQLVAKPFRLPVERLAISSHKGLMASISHSLNVHCMLIEQEKKQNRRRAFFSSID